METAMRTRNLLQYIVLVLLLVVAASETGWGLDQGFKNPPDSAKCWIYWWWLNGYVTKDSILRDLDEMKRQGISGALVFHAGGGETPETMDFLSPRWREHFKFAVEQAARRNITISLNLCAGWNAGGPWVSEENAAKTLVNSVARLEGGKLCSEMLRKPVDDYTYRDITVLGWRLKPGQEDQKKATCVSQSCLNLTTKMDPNGLLVWDAPEGQWMVVRFGYSLNSAHASGMTKFTGSGTYWQGHPEAVKDKVVKVYHWGPSYWEIDPLSPTAMKTHFDATAAVVLQDVREYVGSTFKYVHIDSGEIGQAIWTQTFFDDFKALRGYEAGPYMAAKAGLMVDDATTGERFLEDYDRTIGDLMISRYYGRLAQLAHEQGLGTHSESAGYQKPRVDALRALGCNDISMSEFWSRKTKNYMHQLSEFQLYHHDGIKNAASAAHIYGLDIVQAEAFTVNRDINFDRDFFALKDIGDRAFCAGLNRNVFHHFMSQPEETPPGYCWPGVGVEFNRLATWWPMIDGWLTYLARCQYLLQQGEFVADVCYYQGDWVPVYVPARWAQDMPLPAGYDCDTINSEVLLSRAEAGNDGRLTLANGQAYRYLVFWQGGRWKNPPWKYFGISSLEAEVTPYPETGSGHPLALSPKVLRKLKQLVQGGVTLIGPRPNRSIGLTDYPNSDTQIKKLADELWGSEQSVVGEHRLGNGRVIWGRSLAKIMEADKNRPDMEIRESQATAALPKETLSGIPHPGSFDWIHRRVGGAELFFVANLRNADTEGEFIFRVGGRQPELWDPVTGEIRDIDEFAIEQSRIRIPLTFAPRQSLFIIFQRPVRREATLSGDRNLPEYQLIETISGSWELSFDSQFGGPEKVVFDELQDWTSRNESGIKYYSGIATYRKRFDLSRSGDYKRLFLDLGRVKNVATVSLNGKKLGTIWCAPWRIDITDAVQEKDNLLVIDVANLWMNRLIGDAGLLPEERYTKTNAADKFKPDMPLLPSGLLGPVRLFVIP